MNDSFTHEWDSFMDTVSTEIGECIIDLEEYNSMIKREEYLDNVR